MKERETETERGERVINREADKQTSMDTDRENNRGMARIQRTFSWTIATDCYYVWVLVGFFIVFCFCPAATQAETSKGFFC